MDTGIYKCGHEASHMLNPADLCEDCHRKSQAAIVRAAGFLRDAREHLLGQSETYESEMALYAIADAHRALTGAILG